VTSSWFYLSTMQLCVLICSWQNAGHNFLHDITSVTSLGSWEVLRVEIMSKFCFVFHANLTSEHKCEKNYEVSSGGMEGVGVLDIFNCFSSYSKYLLHKESWCWKQQRLPNGGCREALWSIQICNKIIRHSLCCNKKGSKTEDTREGKYRYKFARWWRTSWRQRSETDKLQIIMV